MDKPDKSVWTHKYIAKSSSEIIGQDKGVGALKDFLKNYKTKKKKAAIIYGDPGNGKTSSVYAIANELDLELLEINASDIRNTDAIMQKVGAALGQQSLFFKSKVILLDEIDGVSGQEDRGGISAVAKLIDKTTFPIIMTANDPFDKKFSDLRKKSEMIEYHALMYTSIVNVLKNICDKEKIVYEESAIITLARRNGGDLRGAITDLQTLAQAEKKLDSKSLEHLSDRERKESIINAMTRIFKTTNPEIARPALEYIEEDTDETFLWLEHNIPKEYKKPLDIQRAYDNLSLSDVFRGRIKKRQHWRFLVYINDLNTAGIALAKTEKYPGFTNYEPTNRILKIWQANMRFEKRKSIAEKIGKKTHCSKKEAIQKTIPYLKKIFEKNPKQAKTIAEELELEPQEIDWLKKT